MARRHPIVIVGVGCRPLAGGDDLERTPYEERWVDEDTLDEALDEGALPELEPVKRMLVIDDCVSWAAALVDDLTMIVGETFSVTLRPQSTPATIVSRLLTLGARSGGRFGIAYLTEAIPGAVADAGAGGARGPLLLSALARELATREVSVPISIVTAGAWGDGADSLVAGELWAFARVFHDERPDLAGVLVDVGAAPTADELQSAARALANIPPRMEVLARGDQCWYRCFVSGPAGDRALPGPTSGNSGVSDGG